MENIASVLFNALFIQLWWFIPLFILVALLKFFKPYLKGKFGEFAVNMHVKKYLNEAYILLNDCTLPDDLTGTTQIDHILLSPYGIFVIETKNYKGWIFGQAHQKKWTQKIYKNRYKFQNPLHQNYKHVQVISSILEDLVDPNSIHSVVVFMPDCEFKTPMPENVFKGTAWIDYVKQFKTEVIPTRRLKRIQLRLEKEALEKSWKTQKIHLNNLKNKNDIH